MQFNILHDCIRSIIYFRHLSSIEEKSTAQIFMKDILSDHVIQSWCKIFGNNGEDTHWKKIAEAEGVGDLSEPFSKESILRCTGMNDQEWSEYHSSMQTARNEFFSHFDMDSMILNYPNLDAALSSVVAYREWLSDLLDSVAKAKINDGTVIVNKAPLINDLLRSFNEEAEEGFNGRML